MTKKCKHCNLELNSDNTALKNRIYWRNECKSCRSKAVVKWVQDNGDWRRPYANLYARRVGRVKEYPCEICGVLCYKKYRRAFCSDECRFMNYVNKTDTCWLWMGAKNHSGYGKLSYKDYTTDPAHRVSYKLFKGTIETDMFICHSCDNPSCVNPNHLWMGDHQENMLDMIEKGRQRSKLTITDVLKIRELYEKIGISQKKIKEQFNITSGHLSNIIHRRIWKHV